MIDTYFGARLVDAYTIKVCIFSNYTKPIDSPIKLLIDEDKIETLTISKQSYLNGLVIFECKTKYPVTLGKSYSICIKDYGVAPLIIEDVLNDPRFDHEYDYDGDDLGFTYTKEETKFKLWAPLASRVYLLIRKSRNETFQTFPMRREEKGVYSLTLKGDYECYKYRYRVINNGISVISTDPYGKASTANGKDSVVIDFNKTKIDLNTKKLPKLNQYTDAVIYELNVRDFTIQDSTNIVHKGKYLGLAEEGRTTRNGKPAGLDYLKMLGITHVQIMPFFDFRTTDELHPENSYNWGYDPQQYFVPEGSYSTDPNDPYARIIELKTMIAKLHENGIKVNMDVVFNHVYGQQFSTFERCVPGYYFRKRKNGTLCNGSACGNDLDTKRPMVRKLIVDACKYWMTEFGIDGFRFDLMGIIDRETMKEVEKACRAIRPDCMLYGEGWDMNTELDSSEKTTIYNSFKTPTIGYFNDSFRDIVRSKNEGNDSGYLIGHSSYREGFKFAFMGSVVNYCYQPRFLNANQSINYVECHDNRTLYDRISVCYGYENNEKGILDVIKECNAIIAFSYGVSFYHAGQEIGLTKYGHDNTYNEGDKYNQFDWNVMEERYDMVKYFVSIIRIKKEIFKNNVTSADLIAKNVNFTDLENGGLLIKMHLPNSKISNIIIAINPSAHPLNLQLEEYCRVILTDTRAIHKSTTYVKNVVIDPRAVYVFVPMDSNQK